MNSGFAALYPVSAVLVSDPYSDQMIGPARKMVSRATAGPSGRIRKNASRRDRRRGRGGRGGGGGRGRRPPVGAAAAAGGTRAPGRGDRRAPPEQAVRDRPPGQS